MQGQLHLAIRAFSKCALLELQLVEGHVGQGLLILVSLTSDSKLACLDERRGFLNSFDLSWVQRRHDFSA